MWLNTLEKFLNIAYLGSDLKDVWAASDLAKKSG